MTLDEQIEMGVRPSHSRALITRKRGWINSLIFERVKEREQREGEREKGTRSATGLAFIVNEITARYEASQRGLIETCLSPFREGPRSLIYQSQ